MGEVKRIVEAVAVADVRSVGERVADLPSVKQ